MPALKCRMCNGDLSLSAGGNMYECPWCGSGYPRSDYGEVAPRVAVIDFGAGGSAGKNLSRLIERADIQWDLGNTERALGLYGQVLELDPGNAKARRRLGRG